MTTQSKAQRLATLRDIGLYNTIPDNVNFGAILNFHRNPALINLLFNTPLRFLLFPLAAIFSIIRAGVSCAILHFDRTIKNNFKKLNLIQAIWDTFQSVSITTAVIVGAIDFFVHISPLVGIGIAYTFTGLLAGGTLYQLGLAAYALHQKDMAAVKSNLIVAAILASYCASVVLCMIMAQLVIGSSLGIITAACAVGYSVYGIYQTFEKKEAPHKKNDESYLLEPYEPEPPVVKVKNSFQKVLQKIGISKDDKHTSLRKALKTTGKPNSARYAIAKKYHLRSHTTEDADHIRSRARGVKHV